MPLTDAQFEVIRILEVTTSIISLCATAIFTYTYLRFKILRTPSNMLIFYASFSNIFANVAAMMGRGHNANNRGAKCQIQAFLIEWFMQSDPLWSAAMAVNVYLCIFSRFDASRLKSIYWIYGLVCYGVPFVPALFCLLYQEEKRGKVYGNAQLWCWIKNEYGDLRIWTFYITIWISIILSLAIYLRVGGVIWQVRNDLRAVSQTSGDVSTSETNSSQSVFKADEVNNEKTLMVAEQPPSPPTYEPKPSIASTTDTPKYRTARYDSIDVMMLSHSLPSSPMWEKGITTYSVAENGQLRSAQGSTSSRGSSCSCSPLDPVHSHEPGPANVEDPEAGKAPRPKSQTSMQRLQWQYTKTAILFTLSILITWIPPSINRARTLTHPNAPPSFPLMAMSAAVLPLQGFWNSVIYVVSSWSIIKTGWRKWKRQRAAHAKSQA